MQDVMTCVNEVKSLEIDNDDLRHDEIDEKPSYDELIDNFSDLHMKYKKLALKNIALKRKILSLTKELEDSSKEKKNEINL